MKYQLITVTNFANNCKLLRTLQTIVYTYELCKQFFTLTNFANNCLHLRKMVAMNC